MIGVTQRCQPYGQFGLTIRHAHFNDYPDDIGLRNYACKQGSAGYGAVIGAIRSLLAPPNPLTHNLRTDRMSTAAQELWVNRQDHTLVKIYSYPRLMSKSR